MSQENVEIMRRAYAAFNRGDIDDLLALMDEDVEAVSRLAAWRCVKGRRQLLPLSAIQPVVGPAPSPSELADSTRPLRVGRKFDEP